MQIKLECGCPINIVDGKPFVDFYNLPLNCPKVWELLASGKTQGVFQLEKNLGQSFSKKLAPDKMDHVSALGAILRPGTLNCIEDGKSMTQRYVDRKNLVEQWHEECPEINRILERTYGIIVYQESSLLLSHVIAGFSPSQANQLKTAISKKKADKLAALKTEFLEGCDRVGLISRERAEKLFDNIEASNRYSFNASHSYSYGIITYWTAWLKSHFPIEFYCSWLQYAEEKQDPKEEISLLVSDAKQFNIGFLSPSMKYKNHMFDIVDGKIRFGLSSITGIGASKIENVLSCDSSLTEWKDVLFDCHAKIDKTSFNNLISCGAFSHINKPRKEMLFEYRHLLMLTGKHEIPFLIANKDKYEHLKDGVYMLLESDSVSSARKSKVKSIADTLANPPQGLIDDDMWIASIETELMGAAISCCKLDSLYTNSQFKCKDFDHVEENVKITIPVEITRVSEYVPKKGKLEGQRMLYLTCSDQTGRIECVVFPDSLKYEHLLFKGNVVYVTGKKSNKGGLTVTEVTQI